MFEPPPQKNRRLTPSEMETEVEICKWLKRPARYFLKDPPFYPWLPPEPIVNQKFPVVNFDLGFQ